MNRTRSEDGSQSPDASLSNPNAEPDSMRFLPDVPSLRIQRWIGGSSASQPHSQEARPKRINADVDWTMEEFERELTLRFIMQEMSLNAGVLFLPTAPTPTAAPAPPPAPITVQSKRSFSLRRRWLRTRASTATLPASASKADSAYEAFSSDEEEDEDVDNARSSTPSTPTPHSYPATHRSSGSSHLQGEEETTTSSFFAGDSTPEADINPDEMVTPGLTASTANSDSLSGDSSTSMSPRPLNLHSREASAGSDVIIMEGDGSDKPKLTRLQEQSKRLVQRVLRGGSFSSVVTPAITVEASTTTTAAPAPAQTGGHIQESAVSLVSRFSSCTSLGDDSSCSSSQDKKQRAPSILQRFRRFTVNDHRGLPHTGVAPPPVAPSSPPNTPSPSLSLSSGRPFRKRTHSSPAETMISSFRPVLPLPRPTIPPGPAPPVPLHSPAHPLFPQGLYPRPRAFTQPHPAKTNHVLSLPGTQTLLPLTILTPPSLPNPSSSHFFTSPKTSHRALSPPSSPRRSFAMPLKPKKKRLVIRGIKEGDWGAVMGLGRWASGLGVVKRMWVIMEAESGIWVGDGQQRKRPRELTVWIEFRDKEVTENVCRITGRVEIPLVGDVAIDWAEGREAG